jgi:hypothetical protein
MLEQAVRARIESAAARHGVVARIGLVHVGVWPLLRLEGLDLDLGHGVRLHADMIANIMMVDVFPSSARAGPWNTATRTINIHARAPKVGHPR